MSYRDIITIDPDKRGGKRCIRRMQIRACLEFAIDREHR